jgi:hypothetical protein
MIAVLPAMLLDALQVAISNSRLLAMDERGVTFRWKDFYGDSFVKPF